jgi:hypothetical protein
LCDSNMPHAQNRKNTTAAVTMRDREKNNETKFMFPCAQLFTFETKTLVQ